MDGNRFDDLAKGLATSHTRRSLLRALAGATLATVAGVRNAGRAAGAGSKGALCNRNSHCASGYCAPRDRAGRRRCSCAPGLTDCGVTCVDTDNDPLNCFACGRACAVNETCSEGACTCGGSGSAAPYTCCGDSGLCYAGAYLMLEGDGTCGVKIDDCPAAFTPCVGTVVLEGLSGPCQVCCPPGTTCDHYWGVCLQGA